MSNIILENYIKQNKHLLTEVAPAVGLVPVAAAWFKKAVVFAAAWYAGDKIMEWTLPPAIELATKTGVFWYDAIYKLKNGPVPRGEFKKEVYFVNKMYTGLHPSWSGVGDMLDPRKRRWTIEEYNAMKDHPYIDWDKNEEKFVINREFAMVFKRADAAMDELSKFQGDPKRDPMYRPSQWNRGRNPGGIVQYMNENYSEGPEDIIGQHGYSGLQRFIRENPWMAWKKGTGWYSVTRFPWRWYSRPKKEDYVAYDLLVAKYFQKPDHYLYGDKWKKAFAPEVRYRAVKNREMIYKYLAYVDRLGPAYGSAVPSEFRDSVIDFVDQFDPKGSLNLARNSNYRKQNEEWQPTKVVPTALSGVEWQNYQTKKAEDKRRQELGSYATIDLDSFAEYEKAEIAAKSEKAKKAKEFKENFNSQAFFDEMKEMENSDDSKVAELAKKALDDGKKIADSKSEEELGKLVDTSGDILKELPKMIQDAKKIQQYSADEKKANEMPELGTEPGPVQSVPTIDEQKRFPQPSKTVQITRGTGSTAVPKTEPEKQGQQKTQKKAKVSGKVQAVMPIDKGYPKPPKGFTDLGLGFNNGIAIRVVQYKETALMYRAKANPADFRQTVGLWNLKGQPVGYTYLSKVHFHGDFPEDPIELENNFKMSPAYKKGVKLKMPKVHKDHEAEVASQTGNAPRFNIKPPHPRAEHEVAAGASAEPFVLIHSGKSPGFEAFPKQRPNKKFTYDYQVLSNKELTVIRFTTKNFFSSKINVLYSKVNGAPIGFITDDNHVHIHSPMYGFPQVDKRGNKFIASLPVSDTQEKPKASEKPQQDDQNTEEAEAIKRLQQAEAGKVLPFDNNNKTMARIQNRLLKNPKLRKDKLNLAKIQGNLINYFTEPQKRNTFKNSKTAKKYFEQLAAQTVQEQKIPNFQVLGDGNYGDETKEAIKNFQKDMIKKKYLPPLKSSKNRKGFSNIDGLYGPNTHNNQYLKAMRDGALRKKPIGEPPKPEEPKKTAVVVTPKSAVGKKMARKAKKMDAQGDSKIDCGKFKKISYHRWYAMMVARGCLAYDRRKGEVFIPQSKKKECNLCTEGMLPKKKKPTISESILNSYFALNNKLPEQYSASAQKKHLHNFITQCCKALGIRY